VGLRWFQSVGAISRRDKNENIHVGGGCRCYYDGAKKIEGKDDTFKDAGKIGIWTKADSVTYFDDLKVVAK
jgi:hypothetical protein